MSGIWLDFGGSFFSLLFIGMAIKLMDDSLDADFDRACGKTTLAARLGRAALPYALLLALVSAAFNLHVALAAFLGSYAAGMFLNWRQTLPTQLPAWLEILGALALSVFVADWRLALWGLAMMCVIDWLDDIVDMSRDKRSGQWNLAIKIGAIETLLLILIALTTAVLTDAKLTALTLIALPIIEMLNQMVTHKPVAVIDPSEFSHERGDGNGYPMDSRYEHHEDHDKE